MYLSHTIVCAKKGFQILKNKKKTIKDKCCRFSDILHYKNCEDESIGRKEVPGFERF